MGVESGRQDRAGASGLEDLAVLIGGRLEVASALGFFIEGLLVKKLDRAGILVDLASSDELWIDIGFVQRGSVVLRASSQA